LYIASAVRENLKDSPPEYQSPKGVLMMNKKDEKYLTHAPKEEMVTVDTDGRFPNLKNAVGDSVDGHEQQETANAIIGAKEIGQQNENL
jgi:hypothetical protein